VDGILRNIKDALIKVNRGRKGDVPNLFSASMSIESYGHRVHLCYHKDDRKLLHIFCTTKEVFNTTNWLQRVFGRKDEKYYTCKLSIDKRDYMLNSKDYPIINGIHHVVDNHVNGNEVDDLREVLQVTKAEEGLVEPPNTSPRIEF
jgi:hypothetical protein